MPPSAVPTTCAPLARDKYTLMIGPRPKPSSPVTKKMTPKPDAELAVRGSTNIPSTMEEITQIKYAMGGTFMAIDTAAITALKPKVADSSRYVFFNTLLVSSVDRLATDA